jgi:hypothetical protein
MMSSVGFMSAPDGSSVRAELLLIAWPERGPGAVEPADFRA